MSFKDNFDEFLANILKGNRKKYIILALSVISALILIISSATPVSIMTASDTNNPIGIESVQFFVNDIPGGDSQHIVGHLYRSKTTIGTIENPEDPIIGSAPAIVLIHGWLNGVGKESMTKWALELARRDFIVLSIDLPAQGHSTGNIPGPLPSAEFEPYIVEGATDYLRALDYVNDSAIGVAGLSYGGSAAALSAGVLGNKINATVVMSGFVNVTNWLIEEQGILRSNSIEFEVSTEQINLISINEVPITTEAIEELFRAYGLVRGESENFENLFIEDTTSINRTELSKLDAVNYLSNARDDSVMFIHPTLDGTFGYTNQSGQGYDSCTNGAIYYPVECDHSLHDCNNATWAIINFFKVKLTNSILTPQSSIAEFYGQSTDTLGFLYGEFYDGDITLIKTIIILFAASIPMVIIVSILLYSKKIETKRADQKFPPEQDNLRIHGGSYNKVISGLVMLILFGAMFLWACTNGVETLTTIIGVLPPFFIAFFFTLAYTQDEAEIIKKHGIPYDKRLSKMQFFEEYPMKKRLLTVIIASTAVIGTSVLLYVLIPKSIGFNQPLDSISILMLLAGILLVTGAILFMWGEIRNHNGSVTWADYKMDRYSITKSLVCGVSTGLVVLVIYNTGAFFLKYPFTIGARSPYYIFVLASVLLYSIGLHLWTQIILPKYMSFGAGMKNKVITWLISTIIGIILVFVSGLLIGLNVLDFGIWLNINLPVVLGLGFAAVYLIIRILDLISSETGLLSGSIYAPLILVTFFGYFFRI